MTTATAPGTARATRTTAPAGRLAAVARWRGLPVLLLALVAYVPLLLTEPGAVGADTKAHLYTDPARLLSRAWSLWDPNIGLGTVTHQNIGFLFPVGPYYWLMDTIGFPDWVAQRVWLGTILFLAGLGTRAVGRHLGLGGAAATVAGLVYLLSPYTLAYAARISVILLPWAALPWMVLLAARAAERGGWRDPARFALVVALVGGVNATALVLAGLGPVIWLVAAVVTGRVTARAAWTAAARIGVLTTGVSLWWLVALAVQGQYGIPILQYSETAQTVASSSLANEVWRGLGYWFLYGEDRLGPWIEPGQAYTQRLWLLAASYALPVLALAAVALVRWSARVALGTLAVVGLVIAVGAYPWDAPSPLGRVLRGLLSTDAGLAFRSLPRAAPLLVLAVALFLGAGITALAASHRPRRAAWAGAGVVVLALVVQLPLFTGGLVDENLQRPEELPAYWAEAAAYLDDQRPGTRVLEVPGADFASYRWGNTVDPISSGIMDRPTAYRELIPYGSPPAADLLIALDRRMQEGIFEPASLAPTARLLGVGDVLYRADLQFERFRTPRPRWLSPLLEAAPGLGEPTDFGVGIPNEPVPEVPMLDDLELALDPGVELPPALRAYPVLDAVPILRRQPTTAPVVLAGDGDGIVDAAAAGLLDGDEVVLYSASVTHDAERFDQLLDDGAVLVLTDTNRQRGHRWSTVRENRGQTERADHEPLEDDPTDNRLELFPDARDDAVTVADDLGGVRVRATSYGNGVSFTPEFRARNAVDGDLRTAWRTAAGRGVEGERIVLELAEPVDADEITLVQAFDGANRWITEIELTVDDGEPVRVALDESSRSAPGQVVPLGVESLERLEIELTDSDAPGALGASEVGFTEIGIPGVTGDEVIVLPRDLLGAAGSRSLDHDLAVVLTRLRVHPSEAVRRDEEMALDRLLELPTGRELAVAATARLNASADDPVIDAALGLPLADEGGITATSSRRLFGDPTARASSTVDGDRDTWWSPAFTDPRGDWVELELPEPVTVDRLDLAVVADGRHSVPTALAIENERGDRRVVDLPAIEDRAEPNAVVEVPVEVEPITGRRLRVVVEDVREVVTIDWFGRSPTITPPGIAELGIDGVRMPPPDPVVDTGCRADLLSVDGTPVPIRLRGDVDDALQLAPLEVAPCGDDAVAAGPGPVRVTATPGLDTGFDLDRVVLTSTAGGAAGPVDPPGGTEPLELRTDGRAQVTAAVPPSDDATWVILGQSWSEGWRATLDGDDLGPPTLVDGFANGWRLPPSDVATDLVIEWRPQRLVTAGLVGSAAAAVAVVLLALFGRVPAPASGPGAAPPRLDTAALAGPAGYPASRRDRRRAALVAALVALLVAGPLVGAVTALLLAVAVHHRRGRAVLALAAPAALGAAGLYVLTVQARYDIAPGFDWPSWFHRAHPLGLLAGTALLGLLVLDSLARRERDRRAD